MELFFLLGLHTGRSKGRCVVVYKSCSSGRPCEGEISPSFTKFSVAKEGFKDCSKTNVPHNNLHSPSLTWNLYNYSNGSKTNLLFKCAIFRLHSLNFGRSILQRTGTLSDFRPKFPSQGEFETPGSQR